MSGSVHEPKDVDPTGAYCCCGCEEIFQTFWKFRAHFMKAHAVTHKLFCKYCKKKFTRPLYYKSHFSEEHPGKSLFPCFCCRSSFEHKYDLNKHMKDHIELEDLRTKLCKIKKRRKGVQNEQCVLVCEVCEKEFARKIDLYRHLLGVKVFLTCTVCQRSFCTRDAMEEHSELHFRCNESLFESLDSTSPCLGFEETSETSDSSEQVELVGTVYKCQGCRRQFPTPKMFHDHFVKVHTVTTKGHRSIYEQKFSHLFDLKSCFPKKKLFPCLLCNKTFNREFFLKEHLKTHDSRQPESIACEFCGKRFENRVDLYRHRRVIFTCSICQKDLCTQKALTEHAITHQESEPKPAPEPEDSNLSSEDSMIDGDLSDKELCPKCKEEFVDPNMLKTHKCGSVAGTKTPVSCSFCTRSFAKMQHLKLHLLQYHKNVRVFMV